MSELQCISCKKRVANVKGTALFKCPNCASFEIVRCTSCREIATRYKCPNCSFSGPN